MYKQTRFVALMSLLLMGGSLNSHAQMGSHVPQNNEGPRPATNNGDVHHISRRTVFDRGFKLPIDQPIVAGVAANGGQATLTLKTNALVMERTTLDMAGDTPHEITTQVWSIPFSGAAKEMEFQSDGNLVVRDSGNKVLWASNRSAPNGRQLVVDFNGKLQVYNENGGVLWEK